MALNPRPKLLTVFAFFLNLVSEALANHKASFRSLNSKRQEGWQTNYFEPLTGNSGLISPLQELGAWSSSNQVTSATAVFIIHAEIN